MGQGKIASNREGRFRLNNRKKFFTVKLMRSCNRLPREAVEVLTLDVSDRTLNNLVQASRKCPYPWHTPN